MTDSRKSEESNVTEGTEYLHVHVLGSLSDEAITL